MVRWHHTGMALESPAARAGQIARQILVHNRVLDPDEISSKIEAVTAAELKEANGNLDDATQPLAELMMDRVMAEMLEKRGVLPG